MLRHDADSPATTPRRVLVVEDQADGREALRLLLRALGHSVDVADNGLEAVRKALRQRPDVVVLDIGLPKLDGCAVAERLRNALGAAIVLVAYTAYDPCDMGLRIEETPFDCWLVKPVALEALKHCLEQTEVCTS